MLGTPISAGLNYAPSTPGNPYSGILAGPAGLAAQYGASYNQALAANQTNYNNIIGGYQTVMNNVGDTLGQGGGWGVAAPAAQAIADTYAQQSGGALQNSINRGIGNTTAATAAQRGAALDANKAYAGLGSQLASTYAGYEANLGQAELGFMNNVQIPYPNGAEYSSLYQQYGQQQQAQASMAQQLALSQQQMRMAAGRGGAGGVSIPSAPRPRGGTYGSGGGGFASGGGVTPINYGNVSPLNSAGSSLYGGIATNNVGQNNAAGAYRPPSGDGPATGGFDPWNPGKTDFSVYTDQENDPYTGQSPSGDSGSHFGNTGGYLGIGWG